MSDATAGVTVAHSSDLHLAATAHVDRELEKLAVVLEAASDARADVLVLAGDIFDSHRASQPIVEGAAQLLADAPLQTVILPGNHDPATPEAVYRRYGFSDPANVHVLGVSAEESVAFAELDLLVSGAHHAAYVDYAPLAAPSARSLRWHVVVAHGHWVTGPHDAHRGWLIHDHEIAALDADYVALGHWDLPQSAGDGRVPAYYSGSPDIARTINVVRLDDAGVDVRRHPLRERSSASNGR